MKNDAPEQSESSISVMATLSNSPVSVYVFNCVSADITSLEVNGTNVVAAQGIPALNLGSPPSSLAVLRSVFGKSALTKVTFEGDTNPSWAQTISIVQPPMINMYLWCYYNGYVLTDQNGIVNYVFAQTVAMGSLYTVADEWPEPKPVISMAV